MKRLFLSMCVILSGCATVGMPTQPTKPLAEHSTMELCHFYYSSPTEKLRSEIGVRTGFPESEWETIDAHRIRLGMSAAALVCSWGLPTPFGDINRYVGRWGNDAQWVYRKCRYCEAVYVYTEDGMVTSWSD